MEQAGKVIIAGILIRRFFASESYFYGENGVGYAV
jgi:hypothetical protein